jgi:ABC-type nitrate/sulfonate/bicarbonate transport system permease component
MPIYKPIDYGGVKILMMKNNKVQVNLAKNGRKTYRLDWNNTKMRLALQIVFFFLLIFIWEIGGRRVNPLLMSYPSKIVGAALELIASGELFKALWGSLQGIMIGTLIAIVIGIFVGILIGTYKTMEVLLDPYINALYSTPLVALIPLMMLWIGMGLQAKIVIVALMAVFPIIINTFTGVKNIGQIYHDVAKAFGTSGWHAFTKIVIPASIPYIMSGIRLAVGRAIIAQIVAEFLTAISGLGGMIIIYSNAFETAKLFVPIIVLALLGEVLARLVKLAERKISPWRQN